MHMKTDTQNVLITFSLVTVLLCSGSFLHTQMVRVEDEISARLLKREQEELVALTILQEQLIKLNFEQEEIKAIEDAVQVPEIAVATQEVVETAILVVPAADPVPVTIPKKIVDTTAIEAQAAAKKAQADALANQIADAKLAAEKTTAQKVAATPVKVSRTSKAS